MDNINNSDKKFSLNICRCCLTEGCYKDISNEYYYSGQKEIYEDMLKDVFDLQISYQNCGGPSSTSRLICEDCISRLRDAKTFKDTVLQSEKSFKEFLVGIQVNDKEECEDLLEEEITIKLEESEYELNGNEECYGTADNAVCSEPYSNENLRDIKMELNNDLNEIIEPTSGRNQRKSTTDATTTKKINKISENNETERKDLLEEVMSIELEESELELKCEVECCGSGDNDAGFEPDKNEDLCDIKMELNKDLSEIIEASSGRHKLKSTTKRNIKTAAENNETEKKKPKHPEKHKISESRGYAPILRKNSLNLIANSTICAFQWNKGWYRCFICKEAFPDLNQLREHSEGHPLKDIEGKMIAQQNRMVKVEVTQLFCKLCKKELRHLPELRDHLTEAHKMQFDLKEDLLIPFKIDTQQLQCQICNEPFLTFRLLNLHMNKHYQKHVCHVCGATFSNLVFLNLHKTRSHRSWLCKDCDVVFTSKADKKHHDVSVHKVKFERKLRFPCPYCQERFSQENFRAQHLVERHGMPKPEFKCDFCAKIFITRSLCNNHVKNVHQKEKNHECDICHHLFYTKSDVARHRVTHTREKKFSCESCNSPFATKDSLRRHMKRTHLKQ